MRLDPRRLYSAVCLGLWACLALGDPPEVLRERTDCAFKALTGDRYQEIFISVVRQLRAQGAPVEVAEDLVQTAITQVLAKPPQSVDPSRVGGLVYTIAKRRLVDTRRAYYQEHQKPTEQPNKTERFTETPVEEETDRLTTALGQAWIQLPEKQRQAVLNNLDPTVTEYAGNHYVDLHYGKRFLEQHLSGLGPFSIETLKQVAQNLPDILKNLPIPPKTPKTPKPPMAKKVRSPKTTKPSRPRRRPWPPAPSEVVKAQSLLLERLPDDMAKAFSSLSPHGQELLVRRYALNESRYQIAYEIGITPGTVLLHSQVYRDAFRRALGRPLTERTIGKILSLPTKQRLALLRTVTPPFALPPTEKLISAFRNHLNALPPKHHQALKLVFAQDLSIEEASLQLGISSRLLKGFCTLGKRALGESLFVGRDLTDEEVQVLFHPERYQPPSPAAVVAPERRAFDSLNPRQRQALGLFFREKRTGQEADDEMGISRMYFYRMIDIAKERVQRELELKHKPTPRQILAVLKAGDASP